MNFATCMLINITIIYIKHKIVKGAIIIDINKLDIIKYVLNIFKWNIISGKIKIWAEIETEMTSFVLSIIFLNFNGIKYFYFLFFNFILFKIFKIVLLNNIIPIVPPYDNCNPKFMIKNGL